MIPLAYVYGSRSFAQTVTRFAAECGVRVLGYIDDFETTEAGSFDEVSSKHAGSEVGMLIGVGYRDLQARWEVWQRVKSAGWSTPTLVHARAYVAPTARIGEGSLIMAGAVVDHGSLLGAACVLWPQACVNHDCDVGPNCFLSPQALLCGDVRLGAHSFVGAQAAIINGAELPQHSFLRMGSCELRRQG